MTMFENEFEAGIALGGMSLRKMRDHLTEIIESNERCGWPERNDAAVSLRVRREGRKVDRFYLINRVDNSLVTINTPSGAVATTCFQSFETDHELKLDKPK